MCSHPKSFRLSASTQVAERRMHSDTPKNQHTSRCTVSCGGCVINLITPTRTRLKHSRSSLGTLTCVRVENVFFCVCGCVFYFRRSFAIVKSWIKSRHGNYINYKKCVTAADETKETCWFSYRRIRISSHCLDFSPYMVVELVFMACCSAMCSLLKCWARTVCAHDSLRIALNLHTRN